MTKINDVIKLLEIQKVIYIGSYLDEKIKYKSDIDLNDYINWKGSYNDLFKLFQDKYKTAYANPNIFITDFKLGEYKENAIHWKMDDVMKGYVIRDKIKYYFIDFLKQPSIIKMDIIAIIDGKLVELSNNYFFTFKDGSTTNPWSDKNVPISILSDFFDQLEEGNYFKSLKRLYSYYKIVGKVNQLTNKINAIIKFLNSPLGQMNQYITQLKTLDLLVNNNFRKPPLDIIMSNLKEIESKLPVPYHKLFTPIYKSKSLPQISSFIENIVHSIKKDIDGYTYYFIKSNIYS